MLQAAEELEQQLDAMADYARLCLRPARRETVALSTVLRSVVDQELARFGLGGECVELAEDIPPVLADAEMVHLIFRELIANALTFIQPTQAPRVKISGRRAGDEVETVIQDAGLGIPADCLTLLGKPFQRFHGEAHLAPGMGMGLARVGRGLAAIQGRLRCATQPGEGSLFVVCLRAA